MATEKIAKLISKYLTNEELLKKVATVLLEADEFEDGAILADEDFETLNQFAEVF